MWDHLRQKKVIQWSLAYLAGAWVVLQLIDVFTDRLGWSDLVFQVALAVLVAGLPATVVLAWYHGERGAQRVSKQEAALLSGVLLLAAAGVPFVVVQPGSVDPPRPGR
jgi:hypothetical protein